MQWLGDISNQNESALRRLGNYAEELRKEREERKSKVALEQMKQNDQTRQYLQKAYQNYWNKSPQDRALFDQSDAGKEFLKVVKKYVPELINNNKLVPLPSEPKNTNGWKPQSRAEALQYAEDKARAQKKVDMKEDLNPGEAMRFMESTQEMYNNRVISKEEYKHRIKYAQQFLPKYQEYQEQPKENLLSNVLGVIKGASTGGVSSLVDDIKRGKA